MSEMIGATHYMAPLEKRLHRCIFEEDGVQCNVKFDRMRTRRKYCKLHAEVARYEQTKRRWKRQYEELKASRKFAVNKDPNEDLKPIKESIKILDEDFPYLKVVTRKNFNTPGWQPTIRWEEFKRLFGLAAVKGIV